MIALLAVLTACGQSGSPNPFTFPDVVLTFNGQPVVNGVISTGPPGGIAAVTGGGGPPYIFSVADASVATIALAPGTTGARRQGAPQTLVSVEGQVQLSTVGNGTTTMTVSQLSGRELLQVVVHVSSVPASPAPTPSATPTATPVPTPTPTVAPLVLSTTAVSFTALNQTQGVTVSQSGGSSFDVVSSNTAVATVSPATTGGAFTITAAGAGTATVTVTGSGGASATIRVGVTVTGGVIQ